MLVPDWQNILMKDLVLDSLNIRYFSRHCNQTSSTSNISLDINYTIFRDIENMLSYDRRCHV